MVLFEGLLNISVIYKNHQRLHKQIQQDALNLMPDLLNNKSVDRED
jgi:hypothetical protein